MQSEREVKKEMHAPVKVIKLFWKAFTQSLLPSELFFQNHVPRECDWVIGHMYWRRQEKSDISVRIQPRIRKRIYLDDLAVDPAGP